MVPVVPVIAPPGPGRASARRTAAIHALVAFFQNVERVAVMELHAHRAQNRAHRAGGATLLADHFAHILRRHAETQNRALVPADRLDLDRSWFIHQSLSNLAHQIGHRRDHIVLGHALATDLVQPVSATQFSTT